MYPVGSVVASVNVNFDPNKIYNGTWARFAKGQTLVGVNEDDTDFAAGKSGGEKAHVLSIEEMPAHSHYLGEKNATDTIYSTNKEAGGGLGSSDDGKYSIKLTGEGVYVIKDYTDYCRFNTTTAGSDTAHNNLQPYTTVYYWQRTA